MDSYIHSTIMRQERMKIKNNLYWRKNGGSLSSVTTLTGNVPTGSTNGNAFQWSTQNGADATRYGIVANHFTYER